MCHSSFSHGAWRIVLCITLFVLEACNLPEPPASNNAIPTEYATKHMPEGWWIDQAIVEEGRNLYLGRAQSNVNYAKCHGKTGKPTMTKAPDFRNTENMKKYSDSHMFWRISEGVPYTAMRAFKGSLSEGEIWKVIVFVSTLGMEGLYYDTETKGWVSAE